MIYGMEMLENRELIDRRDGKVNVTITASDAVSGVKEFYVNIQNTDNTVSKTYHPDADGSIRMESQKMMLCSAETLLCLHMHAIRWEMKRKYPKERRNSDWRLTLSEYGSHRMQPSVAVRAVS